MERNERLKAADKCASRYTNENEARIAKKAFMLGCEFEAQGEAIKGVILDTLQEPEVDLEKEIEEYWIATGWSKVMTLGKFKVIARYFYGLGQLNAK